MSQSTDDIAESSNVANAAMTDPSYITYLLDPKQDYNCYFVVGNPTVQKPEKIGVVKKMLMAHSLVLRAELHDSKIAEKNDVDVTDIFPETFKNLLRYVYGYDNIATLSFDEADNLLYAADKYMIDNLKSKLATHIMSMLDYTNLCALMNNPACYSVLELNAYITEILQVETEMVLASPHFLELSPLAFLIILQQETSEVDEVELWRAAVDWAKNRANSEDGKILRNELSSHLKHLRVCSMSGEDIFTEVLPTKILSFDELELVGQSLRTGEVQLTLTSICNIIIKRDKPLVVNPEVLELNLDNYLTSQQYNGSDSTITLKTRDVGIELCSVDLYPGSIESHQCTCSISIEKHSEVPTVVIFEGHISSQSSTIPIVCKDRNVQLLPNCLYIVRTNFYCSANHAGQIPYSNSSHNINGKHFAIDLTMNSHNSCIFHFKKILYKTVSKRVRNKMNAQQ